MAALNSHAPAGIRMRRADLEQMRADVVSRLPEEACGLLAGRVEAGIGIVSEVIPATNVLHSRVRYRIDPYEQLAAFERIDAAGMELVGIYHSHPEGPDGPSATDLAEAFYPEAIYLIWSGAGIQWHPAAFRLEAGIFKPVTIEITPGA